MTTATYTSKELFLKDMVRVLSYGYDTAEKAIQAIRSMGAYEDSGMYHVNLRGIGSFAFKVVQFNSLSYNVILAMTYEPDGDDV